MYCALSVKMMLSHNLCTKIENMRLKQVYFHSMVVGTQRAAREARHSKLHGDQVCDAVGISSNVLLCARS